MEEVLKRVGGLGLLTLERLKRLHLSSPESVAAAPPSLLADILGISEDKAVELAEEARREARLELASALEVLERRRARVEFITTGVRGLDSILGGGVETGCITEFAGEFGAGKTQLCHQLAVMVQLPEEEGGLGSKAVYLDTEGTFRPERILEICEYRGLDSKEVLRGILYARIKSRDQQLFALSEAARGRFGGARLVLVDTITGLFTGYRDARERRRYMGRLLRALLDLLAYAIDRGVAIVVCNRPSGEGSRAVGDPYMASATSYRILISRGPGATRSAILAHSPTGERKSCVLEIREEGVVDAHAR